MSKQDTSLEEKIAFVERHVEELDGVVRELYGKLTSLREEVSRLQVETKIRIDDLGDGSNDESLTS